MKITIREILNPTRQDLLLQDESFIVDAVLVLHARDNRIMYTVEPVPPYSKTYPFIMDEAAPIPGGAERTAYVAYVGAPPHLQRAGRILLKESWNHLGYIEDLCVDAACRRHGIAGRLLELAEEWAKARSLPGIMLETQDNNVCACRLYEKHGYQLRGFDTHLYKGIPSAKDEIALYWYKMFMEDGDGGG